MNLDVIIEIDTRASPFRELPILLGKRLRAPRSIFSTRVGSHRVCAGTLVYALHDQRDGIVALGEREERQPAQSPENIGLCKQI